VGWRKIITSLLVSDVDKYLNKYYANILSRTAVVYSLVIIHLTFKSLRFCNDCIPKADSFYSDEMHHQIHLFLFVE